MRESKEEEAKGCLIYAKAGARVGNGPHPELNAVGMTDWRPIGHSLTPSSWRSH